MVVNATGEEYDVDGGEYNIVYVTWGDDIDGGGEYS